jgi:hypothetical protein
LWTWLYFLFFLDLHVSNFFFFFSLGPSCVHFFLFFTWTFICPYFFYSHVSFVILTWGEREREINT